MIRCVSCIHKQWLINQGITWCDKNHEYFNVENIDCTCSDYEKEDESVITTATVNGNVEGKINDQM